MLKIFVDGIDGNFERKSIHILAPNQEQAEQLRKMQLLRMAYSINKLVKALRQNRTTRLDSYTISIHCKMSHNRFFAIGFFWNVCSELQPNQICSAWLFLFQNAQHFALNGNYIAFTVVYYEIAGLSKWQKCCTLASLLGVICPSILSLCIII